ncbi:MAG: T9SS type A sorting domain-containing protein, partial [Bacteroidales bacterium]
MVRDIATGDTLTVDGIGTGGALSLGGDLYNSSADFEVVAVDTASGCSRILSDSWHLEVLPDETPDVSITSGSGTDVCSGDAVNLTSSTYAAGSSPAFSWLLNGMPTGDTGDAMSISTLNDGDSIQLIMNSSYTCATMPVDTSDALYFNVQGYPLVSFDYESEYCANEDITVTYTGDETGVSIAWEVYGTMQTETGPGTHNFDFSTPAIVDITAIGTTSFGCETSHTETTEVLANPVASFIMPSDLCANQEFQVEYTGTETGMDTIIWTTSPAPIQSSTGVGIHTFTAYGTGSFDVMINVTDNNGCTASAIQTAPVHQQPVVDFTIPAEACAGQQIQAEYIGTEWDNTNVSWYVDDTDQGVTAPGTGTVWLDVPETTGTIDVMASAITDYGCTNDTTHSLTVNDSPTPPLDDTTWICPNQATLLDAENPGAEYNWSTGDTTQVISLYNNTGFLSVMIDNGVCSIVDTTELVMYPSDMFEFPEGTDTVVCTGDSLYLDVFPPYTGVEWHLYGDTVSGSELAYPYVGQDSVLVEVFAYNENGCPGMDTLMVYYQTCSGVKDIAENLSVDLFPNPAGNKLYIKASTTMNMDISIHDLTGKILLTKSKCSGDTMFDVYGLPEGMYLVRIDSGKETITKKLNIVR